MALAGIGVVGGVLSGLFAIGGGILMVPLLMWRAQMDQRQAAATSLAAIVPTSLLGSATYLSQGDVDVPAAAFISVGAAGGAVVGTAWLRRIPVATLRWMFIVFILVIAARLVLVVPERGDEVELTVTVAIGYIGLGLAMGIASGLFGIGGGIIAVPLMITFFAIGDLVAKGTALLVTVPTSVVGTAANRRAGLVVVRVGLIVGATSAVVAVPAALLAQRLSPQLSGALFAALLAMVAAHMTLKALKLRREGTAVPPETDHR